MTEINVDISRRINSRVTLTDDVPTITANDSLNLAENQQQRRRTNRVNNQRKNTGKIIWNDVCHFLFPFLNLFHLNRKQKK
jgi:hypothetical protein